MPGILRRVGLRGALLMLAVLLGANATFLAIRVLDGFVPKQPVREELRRYFASGVLGETDYPRNILLGLDQYTECTSFQLAALGNDGLFANALAPRLISDEALYPGTLIPIQRYRCRELHRYLDGVLAPDPDATYTRFWHGQSTLLAVALNVLPVDGYQALLLDATLALIALAAVLAALQGPPLLGRLAPLLLFSFALGGQFGYGQLVSHGSAHLAIWAMACCLIARQHSIGARAVLLLAVLAGSLEAFLDMMISIPFAAGVFLLVAMSVAPIRRSLRGMPDALLAAAVIAAAFCFGLIGSYLIKLGLTAALLGWDAVVGPFLTQLRFRAGILDPSYLMPGRFSWFGMIGLNILQLLKSYSYVGYFDGEQLGASWLIALIGIAGWVWGGWRAIRAGRDGRLSPFLVNASGYLAASLLLLAWIVIFPEHTFRHTSFMSRSAVLWLAGGWGMALGDRFRRATPSPEYAD